MSYQRDYQKRINVAVVGAGSHAYRNIIPALHYLPVNLNAICDVNEDSANRTAAQFGCRAYSSTGEMYARERLDAVLLVVGPAQHPALACEAFDANLHVWMEKPAAIRADEVQTMIDRRGNRVAVVGLKKIFMPSARKALEIVNSPKYGGLKTILAAYPMDIPADGAQVLEQRRFTNWLGNGCHPLSLMLRAGGTVDRVTTHRGGNGGGALVLEFANGVMGTFHLASGPQPIESYSFFAAKWHLHIDNSLRVTLQRGYSFIYGKTTTYAPEGDDHGAVVWESQNCLATLENKAIFTQGIFDELKHFCDCVLAETAATEGTLEFALDVMRVYEAALLSDGRPIQLPK